MAVRLARFEADAREQWGIVNDGSISVIHGSVYEQYSETGEYYSLSEVKILPPVKPSKIIGIGLNYRDHAEEAGYPLPSEPLFFLKAPSSIIGQEEPIVLPFLDHEVHHEAELAFVISRRAKGVAADEAQQYVLGYTCGNDVSDRTLQRPARANSMAKSIDTFSPLGPFLVTGLDPANLAIQARVNGKVRQSSSTRELVFDVPRLLSYLSHLMTLLPGDVVLTGTPSGVSAIRPGDVVEIEIDGVGVLRNPVRSA